MVVTSCVFLVLNIGSRMRDWLGLREFLDRWSRNIKVAVVRYVTRKSVVYSLPAKESVYGEENG